MGQGLAITDMHPARSLLAVFSMTSTAGIKNASVLPVPVFAFASTSLPVRAAGIACCCTVVICSYLNTSRMDCLLASQICNSAKRSEVIADMVVLDVRDSACHFFS